MVENDDDFPAVLRQIMSLQGALEKIRVILIRGHLANCIQYMLDGDDRVELERAIAGLGEFLKDAGSR
jgi:DNA-binding FrmR family transcriptional regulator